MPLFRVMPEWYSIDQLGDAKEIDAVDPEDAAEEFVRLNYDDLEYPEDILVIVRDEEDNDTKWYVYVSLVAIFSAVRPKDDGDEPRQVESR